MSIKKGFNRRDFLKVLGAGTGLAASGCAKDVPEKLIPYVVQPEEIIPGNATWYAGTCNECSAGCGVLVRTKEGRALKVEGNPKHPVNRGGLCVLGQSSVQALYDPDRLREPLMRGVSESFKPAKWRDALDAIADNISQADTAGKKTVFISKHLQGSEKKIFNEFRSKFNQTEAYEFDLLTNDALVTASEAAFGKGARVSFAFNQADVILGVGADYLETWGSPVKYAKDYSERRVPEKLAANKNKNLGISKVYHIEPRFSLTAANADYWFKNSPASEVSLLKAILHLVSKKKSLKASQSSAVSLFLKDFSLEEEIKKSALSRDQIDRLVKDLVSAEVSLIVAGGASVSHSATAAASLALILNDVLGNIGKSVLVSQEREERLSPLNPGNLSNLVGELNSGNVANVVFIDVNPVYSLPQSSGFQSAVSKAKFVTSFSTVMDETTSIANVVLPLSTSFEAWSDSEPVPNVYAVNQPSMQPLYKTQGIGDIILSLDASPKNIAGGQFKGISDFKVYLDQQWKERLGEGRFNKDWSSILAAGGDWSAATSKASSFNAEVSGLSKLIKSLDDARVEVSGLSFLAFPTVQFHDGRGANRSWMQEIPDPMTTAVWGSWIEIHPDLAEKNGVAHGDVIQVKTNNGAVEAPAFVTKHIHPNLVASPLGLGHSSYGRYGSGIGTNATAVLDFSSSGDQINLLSNGVSVRPSLAKDELVTLQFSSTELARGFVRGVTEEDYKESILGHKAEEHHEGGHHNPLALGPREEPKQMYKQMEHPMYRWGMSIDLAACTGCSACVAACYAENNVPVVGKQVCNQGREMSWLKIARYFDGPEEHPVTGFAPSLCQHCGNAPCEPVCPVYGTYHSEDGLNTMVYNRCVGTRYCSNNCSYKVRRFNWFNYEWPEPLNWQLNPDVTVRGVGIMEKCTFCIQRIREGQNLAKDEGREIGDKDIMPACASSCPTDAIKFGNLLDEKSEVAHDSLSPRGYKILDVELNTQPAITYLAKVTHEPLTKPKDHHEHAADGGHHEADSNEENHMGNKTSLNSEASHTTTGGH